MDYCEASSTKPLWSSIRVWEKSGAASGTRTMHRVCEILCPLQRAVFLMALLPKQRPCALVRE